MEEPRFLINRDGSPFDENELAKLRDDLLSLKAEGRHLDYRDRNSAEIAQDPSPKILIVSGPGTGKSYLFLDRIKYWLSQGEGEILVTSFVRKLVRDLEDDIKRLTEDQQDRVTTTTLHSLARSVLEKNLGTSDWRLKSNIRMIGQEWQSVVWSDVHEFHSEIDEATYSWKLFEAQLFNNEEVIDEAWQDLRTTYFRLCQFYNAVGFPDLIIRASSAIKENKELNRWKYFIIDEYQDFNRAEEILLVRLAGKSAGLLILGDDDQILYDDLKQGKAELIRGLYENPTFTNAILPFCTRCNYYIVESAAAFIRDNPDPDRISKIFIATETVEVGSRINVVACAHPAGVVDYIERFIADFQADIEQRAQDLDEGLAKDAFLLILSPTRNAGFLGDYGPKLQAVVSKYATVIRKTPVLFHEILDYYYLGKNTYDNFALRKVLHSQGCQAAECHAYIKEAIESGLPLASIKQEQVKEALVVSAKVNEIIENDISAEEKLEGLKTHFPLDEETISDLMRFLAKGSNGDDEEAEEDTEVVEPEVSRMNAVELMTIVGSKGLSADHVIVLGFDNRNMSHLSHEAFYVAITRARQSLHLVTGLGCGGSEEAHKYLNLLPEESLGFCKHSKGEGRIQQEGKREFAEYIRNVQFARKRTR